MPIIWDTIGAQTFIRLDGDLDAQGMELAEITRPAVRGRAFRELDKRSNVFQLRGLVDVADAATADALITTYKAMQGTIVAITKNDISRTNYLVLNVQVTRRYKVGVASGGVNNGLYMVESVWTLVYAAT